MDQKRKGFELKLFEERNSKESPIIRVGKRETYKKRELRQLPSYSTAFADVCNCAHFYEVFSVHQGLLCLQQAIQRGGACVYATCKSAHLATGYRETTAFPGKVCVGFGTRNFFFQKFIYFYELFCTLASVSNLPLARCKFLQCTLRCVTLNWFDKGQRSHFQK